MSENLQTNKVVVRYPLKRQYVEERKKYGWKLQNEMLLNRFGNPLPIGERVSQEDLEEKCSYELIFTRDIEPEIADKLDKIHDELSTLKILNNKFGGGRVTAMVFLSIGILVLAIAAAALSEGAKTDPAFVPPFNASWTLLVLAFLGLGAIIFTGVLQVIKNIAKNVETKAKIETLEAEREELLK